MMPTLNEHTSEETAATEDIFNVHRRDAHCTQDLGFNVPIRRTHSYNNNKLMTASL